MSISGNGKRHFHCKSVASCSNSWNYNNVEGEQQASMTYGFILNDFPTSPQTLYASSCTSPHITYFYWEKPACLCFLCPLTWGLKQQISKLHCKQTQQCFFCFVFFLPFFLFVSKRYEWQFAPSQTQNDIRGEGKWRKSTKKPNRTALKSTGVDTFWWRCGHAWPQLKEIYTCTHTCWHTDSTN